VWAIWAWVRLEPFVSSRSRRIWQRFRTVLQVVFILKYYFTKYVEVAVGRAKKDYLNKQKYHGQWEIPTEPEILQEMMCKGDPWIWEADMAEIPWNAKVIRNYLKDEADDTMRPIFACLSDQEIIVVYAKIFREMSYAEIGALIEVSGEKAASIYAYAKKKMKEGRKNYGF